MPGRTNWIEGPSSREERHTDVVGPASWAERLAYRVAGGAMLLQSLILGILTIPVAALLLWPIPSDGEEPRNPALGLPFLGVYLIMVTVLTIAALALLGAGGPGASPQRRLLGTVVGGVAGLELLLGVAWLRVWGADTVSGWAGAAPAPFIAAACLFFALRLMGPDLQRVRRIRRL